MLDIRRSPQGEPFQNPTERVIHTNAAPPVFGARPPDAATDQLDAIRAHWQHMRHVGVTEADLALMDRLVDDHELHSQTPIPAATCARLGLVEVEGKEVRQP